VSPVEWVEWEGWRKPTAYGRKGRLFFFLREMGRRDGVQLSQALRFAEELLSFFL